MSELNRGKCYMPGLVFIVPCTDVCCIIDLRTISYDVPSQEVLTRDAVTVQVDAVVYYKVLHPMLAVVKVFNYTRSTHFMAATALRNVIGIHNLTELLQERETIARGIEEQLDSATYPWGVKVERVEIKDVSLPALLQTTMAAEAGASREARAKVIAADGELRAARALRQASCILADSPAALQLRYLQTLSAIGGNRNSTVIFPLPMDMITPFLNDQISSCAQNPCMKEMEKMDELIEQSFAPKVPTSPGFKIIT